MDNLISKYFNTLPGAYIDKLIRLETIYYDWNRKINLISRKDMDEFILHHVIHSLSIAKIIRFSPGTKILDAGTGGGFPGIPLAIVYPECSFTMVDSVRKKITAVNDIITRQNIKNAEAVWNRIENIKGTYDYVITRAVASIRELVNWTEDMIKKHSFNNLPNGLIAFKGGDLSMEVKNYPECRIYNLNDYFEEEYFAEKKIVYLPL